MKQTLHGFHHIVELEQLSEKLSFLSSNNKNKKEKSKTMLNNGETIFLTDVNQIKL